MSVEIDSINVDLKEDTISPMFISHCNHIRTIGSINLNQFLYYWSVKFSIHLKLRLRLQNRLWIMQIKFIKKFIILWCDKCTKTNLSLCHFYSFPIFWKYYRFPYTYSHYSFKSATLWRYWDVSDFWCMKYHDSRHDTLLYSVLYVKKVRKSYFDCFN